MDSNDRGKPDDADQGEGSAVDSASTPIITTNIAGANAGTFPGGIVAPAAELAGEEEDERDTAPGWDPLEQPGTEYRETGDEGVSRSQRELEADEMNG